ncbi:7428_t:CDS:2, partial [Funneliformis mosseae]
QANITPFIEFHSRAYYTSQSFDLTKSNEILNEEEKEIFDYENDQNNESHEIGISQIIEIPNFADDDI